MLHFKKSTYEITSTGSAIALFTTISCKKEVETDDKINSVEVKKNNQPWPASKFSSSLTSENRLTVFLYGQGEEYIAIQLNQPERTGTITEFNAVYLNLIGGDVIIDNHLIDKDNHINWKLFLLMLS